VEYLERAGEIELSHIREKDKADIHDALRFQPQIAGAVLIAVATRRSESGGVMPVDICTTFLIAAPIQAFNTEREEDRNMQDSVPTHNPRGRFGQSAPYRGLFSEGIRGLSWMFLKATGWHVATDWPDVSKSVIIAAPHTSNYDGLVMLAIAGWYRQKLSWMGKASLVQGPFGGLLRRAGCVPVERSKSKDVVSLMKEAFDAADTLHLAIAPEGTRNANPVWKTGFWHIAQSANVPLFSAVLDFGTREMRLEGPIMPGGDFETDMDVIISHYRDAKGRHPERFCLPGQVS